MSVNSPEAPAAVAETHVSYVFFAGDRAYKLKKPVQMPFLDFSTPEARRRACEREVVLNRRLAPGVYEGVATVVGPDGQVCDHLVVMQRQPADRCLAALVAKSDPGVEGELSRLAERLAQFHASADRSMAIDEAGSVDAMLANWAANTAELDPFCDTLLDPAVVARVDSLARSYLVGRKHLIEQRVADGRIVDGHGDLLASDVFCLEDGPRVLDCLEFNDRLRYGDVLADVAFLAMDIERSGRPDLAGAFLSAYRDAAGDEWPDSLAHHWIAYRAQVRAKVACVRRLQGGRSLDDRSDTEDPRALLALALAHLEASAVRLVLVGGLPGTGKSTLADGLAKALGWDLLRSDVVRKELADIEPTVSAAAPLGSGLYRPEMTATTYTELLARARDLLAHGRSVVLDATWSSQSWRDTAALLARNSNAELVELRCVAPPDLAGARIKARQANGSDPSDVTVEVASALADITDPWPSAVDIYTTGTPDTSLEQARKALATRAPTGILPPDYHDNVPGDTLLRAV